MPERIMSPSELVMSLKDQLEKKRNDKWRLYAFAVLKKLSKRFGLVTKDFTLAFSDRVDDPIEELRHLSGNREMDYFFVSKAAEPSVKKLMERPFKCAAVQEFFKLSERNELTELSMAFHLKGVGDCVMHNTGLPPRLATGNITIPAKELSHDIKIVSLKSFAGEDEEDTEE